MNPNVDQTYNVYLDSENAVKTGNTWNFNLRPNISATYGSKAKLYVRDFSTMNNMFNITGSESDRTFSIITRDFNDARLRVTTYVFPESRFSNGKDFADVLNGIFYDPVNNPTTYSGVKFTWNRYTTKMEFHYLDESNTLVSESSIPNPDTSPGAPDFISGRYVTFPSDSQRPMMPQPINELYLKFPLAMQGQLDPNYFVSSGTSSDIIDFNRDMHNLYISCHQALDYNRNGQTAKAIGGRIIKIPTNTEFGSMIQYKQTEPVYKVELSSKQTDKLSLSFFDDSGKYYDNIGRFTLTLTIELETKIVPIKPELHSSHLSSRNPPLLRP